MASNTCNRPPDLFNGTGSESNYTITFDFLSQDDIKVYVGSANDWTEYSKGSAGNSEEYEWNAAKVIRLNAPAGTNNIMVLRVSDICDPSAIFYAGAAITAEDLNNNFKQGLQISQDIISWIQRITGQNPDNPPDFTDGIDLGDLEDVDISGATNRSYLAYDGSKWVDGDVIRSTDTWASNDTAVASTQAIQDWADGRYLNDTGDVIAGDGITITESSGDVTISVTNSGTGTNVNASGVNVDQVTLWGQNHDHSGNVTGSLTDVGNIELEGHIRFEGTNATDKGSGTFQPPSQFKTSGGVAPHNMTYTLPENGPTNGQILSSQSDGTLKWVANDGGGSTGAIQNLSTTQTSATSVTINISDGGNSAGIAAASTSVAGVMTKAMFDKLDNIDPGAEVNVGTDLSNSTTNTAVTVISSTGDNTEIAAASTSQAGVMTKGMFDKLDGIEANAEENVDPTQTYTAAASEGTLTLSPGGDTTTIPAATDTNAGLMTGAEHKKLDGIPGNADGVLNLGDLNDVSVGGVTDGQIIRWDATNTEWEATDLFDSSTVLQFMGVIDARDETETKNALSGTVQIGQFWVHDDPSESDPANVDGDAWRDQAANEGFTTIDNPGSGSETDGVDPLSIVRGSMIVAGREFDISGTNKRSFMLLGVLRAGSVVSVEAGQGIDINVSGGIATVLVEDSGVTAGSYGDATHSVDFTVDKMGRLTSATEVAIDRGVTSVTGGTGITVSAGNTPTVSLTNTLTAGTFNPAQVTVDSNGVISSVSGGANTNTTYDMTTLPSGTGIRLADSGGNNDDITLTAAGATTITRTSATELTISSTDTNTDTNTTYDLTVQQSGGDNADPFLRLGAANPTGKRDITFSGGTNVNVDRVSATEISISSTAGQIQQISTTAPLTGGGSSGTVTLGMAAIATNRVLGNNSGSNAVPTAVQVTGGMIASQAVNNTHLATAPALTVKGNGAGTQNIIGDLTMTSLRSMLNVADGSQPGTVTSVGTNNGLTGGTITTSGTIGIASKGVTTARIDDAAVTATQLGSNAVTTAKINAKAVTSAKLADDITIAGVFSFDMSKLTAI